MALTGWQIPAPQPAAPPDAPANNTTDKPSPFQGADKVRLKPWQLSPPDAGETPEDRCKAIHARIKADQYHEQYPELKLYRGQLARIVDSNWKPLIPKVADKPFYKSGMVTVCFAVLPTGDLESKSLVLLDSSGDGALDRAAIGAIQSSHFPSLPETFREPRLLFNFQFGYNLDRKPPLKLPKQAEIPGPLAVTIGYTSKL